MTWRAWPLIGALAVGCGGGGAAPPPPPPDAAVNLDGAVRQDGARVGPPGRSDAGLILPPADTSAVLPLGGPVEVQTLEVPASPRRLDVCFSVDTTASFGEEIDAMQRGLAQLIDTLEAQVPLVSFGVTRFEDFPAYPFGLETDHPFDLLTPVTDSRSSVRGAVAALDQPLGAGGDVPESWGEALYQIATGAGRPAPYPIAAFDGHAASGGGTVGGVGFRDDALRVVVQVTDAPAHYPLDYGDIVPGTHSIDEAAEALRAIDARLVGIASRREDEPEVVRAQLERLALATGAVVAPEGGECPTGIGGASREPVGGVCPLVFDVASDGTGLSDALSSGILSLLSTVAYDEVHAEVEDDRLGFVRAVEALSADPPAGAPAPAVVDAHPSGDGIDDTFTSVATGTQLTFGIRLANTVLPSEDYDQAFRVTVRIVGDGQLLAERVVRVTVPAAPADGGTADGGGA